MASAVMCALSGGRLLVLVVSAAFVGVQGQTPKLSIPVLYLIPLDELKVLRATAFTLLIQLPVCRQSCNITNVKFQIKTSSNVSWSAPKDVRIHPSHNDTYLISSLVPGTKYFLRAFVSPPGTYTTTLKTYTCRERQRPVRDLRVVGAGPGWLDVRWTPPERESCNSNLVYETRYRPSGGEFTPLRTYGIVPSWIPGFVGIRPSHPCASWPNEFCLLLVDDVQPGKNHTIQVQVHRLDGRSQEKAAVQSVEGYADLRPLTWGPGEGGPTLRPMFLEDLLPTSAPQEKAGVQSVEGYADRRPLTWGPGEGGPTSRPMFYKELPASASQETAVRSWFVVSLVALVLLVVFSGVVLVLLNSGLQWCGRARAQARGEGTPELLALAPPSPTPLRRALFRGCAAATQWAQPPPPYDDAQRLHAATLTAQPPPPL